MRTRRRRKPKPVRLLAQKESSSVPTLKAEGMERVILKMKVKA